MWMPSAHHSYRRYRRFFPKLRVPGRYGGNVCGNGSERDGIYADFIGISPFKIGSDPPVPIRSNGSKTNYVMQSTRAVRA